MGLARILAMASRSSHRSHAQRRRGREELLAPWLAMAVILGGWGLAARWLSPTPAPAISGDAPSPIIGPSPQTPPRPPEKVAPPALPTIALDEAEDVAALRQRDLLVPVAGIERMALVPSFDDARETARTHEALDILAPRRTPVVAVEAGTIVKLFQSQAGGTTIYQFGANGAYCYYYAHLEAYATGLAEGTPVERGQTIGYVGTTGNAPPDTPHLHFAIYRLGPDRHWWEGVAIDPYLVLR